MAPKRTAKTKVMVFGVFDFLHGGHISFLKQAKKLGDYLIVSVGRDPNVYEIKKYLPVFSEAERVAYLKKLNFVNRVILGGVANPWEHILRAKPDIIALGYDQRPYLASSQVALQKMLIKMGLKTKVIRLKGHGVKSFKSNKKRFVQGIVRKNKGRGKSLDFPTANLLGRPELPEGIFVGSTYLFKKKWPSLVFIGAAETFGEKKSKVEVHILDFKTNIYGKKIGVELLRKIRDNKKFRSTESLVRAMKQDEIVARKFLSIYNT